MSFLSKLVGKSHVFQRFGWANCSEQVAYLTRTADIGSGLPHLIAAKTLSPERVLSIPCPSPTVEDRARDTHQLRGQHLARQDRWADLQSEIRSADQNRLSTPGGMSVAELLSFGARADVVMAVDHALLDGTPAKDAPLMRWNACCKIIPMIIRSPLWSRKRTWT